MKKSCGILMPISALPTKYAIGSLGKSAYAFADFLKSSGHRYWQILPLVQTGFGDSPYQTCCGISGNPYFIDLEILRDKRLLTFREVISAIDKEDKIDYGKLYQTRYPLLRKAFSRFDCNSSGFVKFLSKGKYRDYALYMALKTKYSLPWYLWPEELKTRDESAIKKALKENAEEILFWQWLQYEFWEQWKNLKKYCNQKGVYFIGDLSLYVAYDSVDVWCNPDNYLLNEDYSPKCVAGVPPDYFSKDGQLWGNPVYDYEYMEEDGYSWWKNRIKENLSVYDVLRLDHFRGFDRFWIVPHGEKTAVNGKWVKAPGREIFKDVDKTKVIAEDLGIIDDGVVELIKDTGFAGMKVVLFSFDGGETNAYLPKNITENSVCYTGTHDNDTLVGYLKDIDKERFNHVKEVTKSCLKYYGINKRLSGVSSLWDGLMDVAYASKSNLVVVPMHDALALDNYYRINTPGKEGCWDVRLKESMFTSTVSSAMKRRAKRFNRC